MPTESMDMSGLAEKAHEAIKQCSKEDLLLLLSEGNGKVMKLLKFIAPKMTQ